MPKNIITQMADRLRAGQAGSPANKDGDRSARDSFASRSHILKTFAEASIALARSDPRFADVSVAAKPERVHLRRGTRVVTMRISPDLDHFTVGGSGLGTKFSANPAHLQEGAAVLVAIDDVGGAGYGAELGPADFLEELVKV